MKNIGKDLSNNCIGVYKITCTGNNQCYIGSSNNIKYRWQVHLSTLRKGNHHSIYMQRSFLKYGEDSFVFEVIHTMQNYDELLLRQLEFYYINKYQSKFNSGAFSIYQINTEWKEKISNSTKALYTKGYINPRKDVGKRYNIYNHLGNQIESEKTCSEVCSVLNIKSYHTLNNEFRKYDGFAATKNQYIIVSTEKSIKDLVTIYKTTRFNNICPVCDLDGNLYKRADFYYKSRPHKGKGIYYRDLYKQIMLSDNLYTIVDNKVFTLPGLCHIIQQCINEKHLNILES